MIHAYQTCKATSDNREQPLINEERSSEATMSSLAKHMAHVDPVIVRKCKVTLLRYRASRIVANCDSRIAIEQQFVNKRLIKKPQEQRAKVSRTIPNQDFHFRVHDPQIKSRIVARLRLASRD
jgi:hypothetical protein